MLLGRPELKTRHALAQALGLGPIYSAGALAFLIVATAGPVAPFVMALSTVGILAAAWAVTLYVRRYASAGGFWPAVARAHGRPLGLFLGGSVTFGLLLVGSGLLLLFSGLAWQNFARARLDFDPGWWSGGLGAAVIVSATVYLGVKLSTRVQLALIGLSAIPFLILVVAVILSGGESGHTLSVFDPTNEARGDTFRALLFGLALFGGWEAATALGEESRLPHETISRAILLAIVLSGLFFIAVMYAGVVGFGADNAAKMWGSNPFALGLLADREVGKPLGLLIDAAIIVDLVALLVAQFNALSRLVFSLAREGLMPRPLAAVSARQTPVGGLSALVTFGLLGLALSSIDETHLKALELGAAAIALVSLSTLLLVVALAGRFLAAERRGPISWAVLGVGVAAPALAIYGTLDPFPTGTERWGVWVALGILAITVLWLLLLRKRRQREFWRAGDHALTPEEAAL